MSSWRYWCEWAVKETVKHRLKGIGVGVTAWVIAFWPDKIKTYLEYRVPVWYVLVAVGVGVVVFVSLQRYRAKRRPVAPPDEKIEMLGLTWEVTGWLQLR